jgi:hypothetical protein
MAFSVPAFPLVGERLAAPENVGKMFVLLAQER